MVVIGLNWQLDFTPSIMRFDGKDFLRERETLCNIVLHRGEVVLLFNLKLVIFSFASLLQYLRCSATECCERSRPF